MKNIDLFGNEEKKTLHVIGNGFDIHHGIDSRYSDFQKYLKETGQSYLAGQIETFYPSIVNSPNYKWGDLEKALGEIDHEATYNECTSDIEIDYDHQTQSAAALEDVPQQRLEENLNSLHASFEKWVNHIDISSEKDKNLYQFNAEGVFLNFNYTETLEETYRIPRASIIYIHGRRGGKEKLILGHCTENDPSAAFSEDNTIYEVNAQRGIINIANAQRKNVHEIISAKKEFWLSIKDIERVITYGHSLSEVDIPYFKKIFESIDKNAEWHFGCHSEDDKKRVESLVNHLGIDKQRYCCFNF